MVLWIKWENKYKLPSSYYSSGKVSTLVKSEVFFDNVANHSFFNAFQCLYNILSFLSEEHIWNVSKWCFNYRLTISCNPNLTLNKPVHQINGYKMMAVSIKSHINILLIWKIIIRIKIPSRIFKKGWLFCLLISYPPLPNLDVNVNFAIMITSWNTDKLAQKIIIISDEPRDDHTKWSK